MQENSNRRMPPGNIPGMPQPEFELNEEDLEQVIGGVSNAYLNIFVKPGASFQMGDGSVRFTKVETPDKQ